MADPSGRHDAQDRDQGPAVSAVELDDGGERERQGNVLDEVCVHAVRDVHGVCVGVRGRRGGLGGAREGSAGRLAVADVDVVGEAGADDGEGEDGVHKAPGEGEGCCNGCKMTLLAGRLKGSF